MAKAQDTYYGLAGNAHARLAQTGSTYRHPAEKQRRSRIIGGVLGAMAAGTTSYLAIRGVLPHHTVDASTLMPHGGAGGTTVHSVGSSLHPGSLGAESLPVRPTGISHMQAVHEHAGHLAANHTQGIHAGHQAAREAHQMVKGDELTLSPGDTIEGDISEHLHLGMRNPRLAKIAGWVLHHKGLSWREAHYLPVGYSFRLPSPHVLHALMKAR